MKTFLIKNIVPKLKITLQSFVINPHDQQLGKIIIIIIIFFFFRLIIQNLLINWFIMCSDDWNWVSVCGQ
jgi:hypothetical protein